MLCTIVIEHRDTMAIQPAEPFLDPTSESKDLTQMAELTLARDFPIIHLMMQFNTQFSMEDSLQNLLSPLQVVDFDG